MGDADAIISSLPLAVLLGLIPAVIAYRKGRSFLGWWLGGALMFIVALPWAILMRPDTDKLLERESRGTRGHDREIPPLADADASSDDPPGDDSGETPVAMVQATCTHCGNVADLDETEVARREFLCPFCRESVPLQFG